MIYQLREITRESLALYFFNIQNRSPHNQIKKDLYESKKISLQDKQYVSGYLLFNNGFLLSVLLFLATVLQNTLLQMHHHLVIREAIRFRAAIQVGDGNNDKFDIPCVSMYKSTPCISWWV